MAKKILLTMKGCVACPEAKKLLRKEGVKFKEVDVYSKEGEKLSTEHKVTEVPVMIIDGKKVKNVEKWLD